MSTNTPSGIVPDVVGLGQMDIGGLRAYLMKYPVVVGPAGGDLQGNYPWPTLKTGIVTAATTVSPSSITVDAKGRVTNVGASNQVGGRIGVTAASTAFTTGGVTVPYNTASGAGQFLTGGCTFASLSLIPGTPGYYSVSCGVRASWTGGAISVAVVNIHAVSNSVDVIVTEQYLSYASTAFMTVNVTISAPAVKLLTASDYFYVSFDLEGTETGEFLVGNISQTYLSCWKVG